MSLKTITSTVGTSGTNIPADVATVQYLLNCVPVSQGGPAKELKIDGFAGVLTLEAIKHFQNFRFGSANSLLETNGQTFAELKRYDPLPLSPAVVVPNLGEKNFNIVKAKSGINISDESPKESVFGGKLRSWSYDDESPKESVVGETHRKPR